MKKGYTLAEVLITLAVIGLIAGVLFPVVTKKTPNKEMLSFKKAYSVVERVTNEMINDETLYRSENGFSDLSLVRFEGQTYSGESKFCGLLAAKMGANCNNGSFTTADGMFWLVPNTNFANDVTIIVDVDGVNKGENFIESQNSIKPDRFRINISPQGQINLNNGLSHSRFTIVNSYVPIEQAYRDAKDYTKTYKELKKMEIQTSGRVIGPRRPLPDDLQQATPAQMSVKDDLQRAVSAQRASNHQTTQRYLENDFD